ncbi:MAG: hypothetical protein ACLRMZ_12625 [Blautia marasmi]
MKGHCGEKRGISDVFLGELGRRQVLFQTPVYQNGQVVGGVYEAYPVESLQNAYGGSTYSDAGYSYVLDSSGSIVLAPLRFSYLQIYDNIRDVLKDGGNKTEAVNQFIEALQSGAKGSAVFDFEEEPQFLSFIPLQEKEGWYFVTVIPLSMVEKDGTAIVGMTAHMGAAIVIAVVFSLSVLFAFVLYRNKKPGIMTIIYGISIRLLHRTLIPSFLLLTPGPSVWNMHLRTLKPYWVLCLRIFQSLTGKMRVNFIKRFPIFLQSVSRTSL